MKISEFSIRRPVFAIVISLMLLVLGLVALGRLWQTVREFPDINPPVVSIDTRYRGAAADIVETKITQPIEDRIAGVQLIARSIWVQGSVPVMAVVFVAGCVRGLVMITILTLAGGTPLWHHVLWYTVVESLAAALLAPAVFAVVQWEKRALGLT